MWDDHADETIYSLLTATLGDPNTVESILYLLADSHTGVDDTGGDGGIAVSSNADTPT